MLTTYKSEAEDVKRVFCYRGWNCAIAIYRYEECLKRLNSDCGHLLDAGKLNIRHFKLDVLAYSVLMYIS
jgi:hypothetical protein